jgi:uncharacterized membrane protein
MICVLSITNHNSSIICDYLSAHLSLPLHRSMTCKILILYFPLETIKRIRKRKLRDDESELSVEIILFRLMTENLIAIGARAREKERGRD